jgi:hypothetical protein
LDCKFLPKMVKILVVWQTTEVYEEKI